MSLSRILDHFETVRIGDYANSIHVRRVPIQMHWDESFSPNCNVLFELIDIDRAGLRVNIHEYNSRTGGGNRLGRCDESVGGCDYLVPRSDVQRSQRELECVGTIADSDAVLDAAVQGEFMFEAAHGFAAYERCVFDNLANCPIDILPNRPVLCSQVNERYAGFRQQLLNAGREDSQRR
jgi:hypothetical protein